MTARSTIFQTVQVGVESTPGTEVNANRALTALMIEPGPKVDISKYRAMGWKVPSVSSLNKEWVEADLSGAITYSEIVYPLASLLGRPTPTLGTVAYNWTFNVNPTSQDTPATFTVEQGSSLRAHLFTYGLVNSLGLKFSRDGNEISGTMIGQALQDGITMTASPTTIALIPVQPTEVSVRLADTYAGLAAATPLSRALEVNFNIDNRFGMLYSLNGSSSWIEPVELEPGLKADLLIEANAEGMGLLTTMRAGAMKFMRVSCTGANIATSEPYLLQIDAALRVMDVSKFEDNQGVYAVRWSFEMFYDTTWGDFLEILVRNTLSSL